MIALTLMILLAQAAPVPAATADTVIIAPLPGQSLPKAGCAAYLFAPGEKPVFLALASADPAQLRISLGGTVTDLARTAQQGAQSGGGSFGFAGVTEYESGGVKAVLDMTIAPRADLKDGAAVSDATLRIDRAGADSIVVPVAGIVACAK